MVLGYRMAGIFFKCSEVVAVAKKSEKNKGKTAKRKWNKGNEEEEKKAHRMVSMLLRG